MNQEEIGKIIKDIRKKHNLSQADFAKKYNVTFQAVSKWENGKNIPDIQILKQICDDYDLDLDSLLNSKHKKNKKGYLVLIILLLTIIIVTIILYPKGNNDNFEFKTISTTCTDFKVTGSIAYNKKNSSIYISHVDYCGGDTLEEYKSIECSLFESNKKIDKCDYSGEAITLEKFLADVKFNVDKYEQTCKKYSDNELMLKIYAVSDNDEEKEYIIPLNLEDNCK